MCILSGCDYLESVNGFGLKTAHRYVSRFEQLPRILQAMRMDGKLVPSNYEEQFLKAEFTFNHQTVYNPITRKCAPLCETTILEDYFGRY